MKKLLGIFAVLFTTPCLGQWTTLNIPSTGRYDDVFFINTTTGWTAGGGGIFKTTDGGNTWAFQYTPDEYLRCIEFATPELGFCGSLDSSLFKTTDGGVTWTDVAGSISPVPPGICGLSIPAPNVIYGCGAYFSPAYVIKSTDSGNTWTSIDLSEYAESLVDIHFVNENIGFVSGTANPPSDGGVILLTMNGGASWMVRHKTGVPHDRVWKLQTPDGLHFFGAIEALPFINITTRIVKSSDAGWTWNYRLVDDVHRHMQAVGFMTPLHGWTGGDGYLYETTDGGNTWNLVNPGIGHSYNRFFKLNDQTAFLSGVQIYKYSSGTVTANTEPEPVNTATSLRVFPNPASERFEVEVEIPRRTNCKLELFASDGRLVRNIHGKPVEKGSYTFVVTLENLPAQAYYLVLRTDEEYLFQVVEKQ
ncbi:MAG: photosystem II stability/assembly factor-like protein [Saprospiraceae bacterium]